MRISYNRADRDYAMLKQDYEKLYTAYYSYDKKVLKILEGNQHVFWAEDSSAYVIKNNDGFLFSFYKKPRMDREYFLWLQKSATFDYLYCGQVDTLKPHQFITMKYKGDFSKAIVSVLKQNPSTSLNDATSIVNIEIN
jgi:hypothetical protein